MYIDYKGFLGSTYSDYLPLGQVDSFSADLVAGATYEIRVVSASAPWTLL
ncbi:MAG: hypothetical protein M3Y22_01800 [Pseudomonadota bacterium]|nr:hypothetical protein [Pseudomonadota bacterium]